LPAGAALVLDFTPRGLLLAVFFLLLKDKKTMAQKITLGKRPESFERTVTFPMLEGGEGSMTVQLVYRTRSELAKFDDELQDEIKAEAEKETARIKEVIEAGGAFGMSQQEVIARQDAFNVSYLQRTVKGWGLDIPFDKEALAQLADELPAAVKAIITDYRGAINEGRKGN
jgi:hypothetical protein